MAISPSRYRGKSLNGQKYLTNNRAPRVQIEYDVEIYGAEKKIQLPFVMGVMADLSARSVLPSNTLDERKFLEIDEHNFDDRMKAIQPRVVFQIPNTLSGNGMLNVDLAFEAMSDFSPQAIARNTPALARLLDARTRLANLLGYMDGKAGAEELISGLLSTPQLLTCITEEYTPAISADGELPS